MVYEFSEPTFYVMAGHCRSKNGVASLAYVPAIHAFLVDAATKTWMRATSAGMTVKAEPVQ